MSLEVSAFHNVAEFLQTIILITKWCNQSFQRVQMVGKIFARNLSSRAEVPNSGSAGDVGAVWARPISLTLPICFRWLFLNDTRDLVRFEPIASEPQRGERTTGLSRRLENLPGDCKISIQPPINCGRRRKAFTKVHRDENTMED